MLENLCSVVGSLFVAAVLSLLQVMPTDSKAILGLFILMFSRMKCIWLLTRRLHANSAVDVTLGYVMFKSGLFMVATEDCELWQSFVMLQHGFFCGC